MDNGIDGFDPLADAPMEPVIEQAIADLRTIRNKKVELPITILEALLKTLNKEETN